MSPPTDFRGAYGDRPDEIDNPREHPVPCRECGRPTWKPGAVCLWCVPLVRAP